MRASPEMWARSAFHRDTKVLSQKHLGPLPESTTKKGRFCKSAFQAVVQRATTPLGVIISFAGGALFGNTANSSLRRRAARLVEESIACETAAKLHVDGSDVGEALHDTVSAAAHS
jgi:hypothetical protein